MKTKPLAIVENKEEKPMAGLITHRENKKQRAILIICKLLKILVELFTSIVYGYFVFVISNTYFLSIISGIAVFIVGQVISLIGDKLGSGQRFVSSMLFWLMKIMAIIFESLAILTAHTTVVQSEGPAVNQIISNFKNLYFNDPSSVAICCFVLLGIDVIAAVLPDKDEEWHMLMDDVYIISSGCCERILLPIEVDAAEVQIRYNVESSGLKAEITDINHNIITKLGYLERHGIKDRSLTSGNYVLSLDNRGAIFFNRKIRITVLYRTLHNASD